MLDGEGETLRSCSRKGELEAPERNEGESGKALDDGRSEDIILCAAAAIFGCMGLPAFLFLPAIDVGSGEGVRLGSDEVSVVILVLSSELVARGAKGKAPSRASSRLWTP